MRVEDYSKLVDDAEGAILAGARSVGVLGLTSITLKLLASFKSSGLLSAVKAIYSDFPPDVGLQLEIPVRPVSALQESPLDILIVAADEEKEDLLRAAEPFVKGIPKVILAGYGHFGFRDRTFHEELAQLLVPSLANGYPNTLPHLYQCLVNAARRGLRGAVAEFGMFKGGTTMFLSRVIERLGMDWRVYGFDTFGGFPPRRSLLDMYEHPGCVFTDLAAVERYLKGRNVEIVPGDVVSTCHRLDDEHLVLSFVDTDNYTSAKAVMEVVQERTLVGGAIVFDHFTGVDRFCYTLGERMAGSVLLDDPRYFHLHGTGVFHRQY